MYKKEIINKLKDIEKEKNIRILFCVESGSRAWNMDSKDSDYDVRFVYSRPAQDYLSINTPSETIRLAYDKDGNPHSQEGSFLDFEGKDVIKFARLLFNSNPTAVEWLLSPIVYYGEVPKEFTDFIEQHVKYISLYFHYKSMCKSNYIKYLKSNNDVTYKRYLYSMRGLINAKYVKSCMAIPPMNLVNTVKGLSLTLPKTISDKILKIIELKQQAKEKDIIERIPSIDKYIESFLKDDSDAPEHNRQTIKADELNKAIQRAISPKWIVKVED